MESRIIKTWMPFLVDYTEDDIVERKLFYEGGSSLDDTSISKLVKTISKFCREPDKLKIEVRKDGSTPTIPPLETQFEELSQCIEACRLTALKSRSVISVCEREAELVMEAIGEEEQATRIIQQEVNKAVLDLEFERKMLSIQELPATSETEAKLDDLEKRRKECQNKIERRKKQFDVLADVAKRLETLLQDENEISSDEKLKVKRESSEDLTTRLEIE